MFFCKNWSNQLGQCSLKCLKTVFRIQNVSILLKDQKANFFFINRFLPILNILTISPTVKMLTCATQYLTCYVSSQMFVNAWEHLPLFANLNASQVILNSKPLISIIKKTNENKSIKSLKSIKYGKLFLRTALKVARVTVVAKSEYGLTFVNCPSLCLIIKDVLFLSNSSFHLFPLVFFFH